MKKLLSALAALSLALLNVTAGAGPSERESSDPAEKKADVEEVVVFGKHLSPDAAHIDVISEPVVDVAESLARLPGADANVNGRISGVAQYRGMYGDRVAVTVDGIGMISGGPNAMDAPLSYISPMITEELILERGIPGVASAPESIGGHVDARLARGAFGSGDRFEAAGMLGVRYSGNGDTRSTAGRLTFANRDQRLSLLAELDRSNGLETPAGDILPSQVSRDRFDLSYAVSTDTTEMLVFVGALDSRDTGTPALAMDIGRIDTSIYGVQLKHRLTRTVNLEAMLGYNDVVHSMDNYSLRPDPAPPAFRRNDTAGDGGTFELASSFELDDGSITVGVDGRRASHESRISNPNNTAFFINNFNDIEKDVSGAFAVAELYTGKNEWELGLRYNDVRMDASAVGSGGMMPMMGMAAAELASAFNAADRSRDFDMVDAVVKYRRPLSTNLGVLVDVGTKTRAPSYQEMYLWLPLAATGGLADGRNYVGNLELRPERNNEVVVGLHWSSARFELAPRIFYRDIADYIQGIPSSNMTANMLATMMTGEPALQFDNVDARITGADVGWRFTASDSVVFDGALAYVRGKRTDVTDNLYRLPPPNASVGLNLLRRSHSLRLEVVGFAGQEDVSAYNNEVTTPGYAIANALWAWQPGRGVEVQLQATNLLDRGYQNHTTGINRATGSDILVGERLYGAGRSVMIGAMFNF